MKKKERKKDPRAAFPQSVLRSGWGAGVLRTCVLAPELKDVRIKKKEERRRFSLIHHCAKPRGDEALSSHEPGPHLVGEIKEKQKRSNRKHKVAAVRRRSDSKPCARAPRKTWSSWRGRAPAGGCGPEHTQGAGSSEPSRPSAPQPAGRWGDTCTDLTLPLHTKSAK